MTTQTVAWINRLPAKEAEQLFLQCCGATWWCERMTAERPFADASSLTNAADAAFDAMPRDAWFTAFASHPKIGDLDSLKMRFAGNKQWSGDEQSGISTADEAVIERFAEGNARYEARFGYIFIVCATGKSAAEMLSLLEARLDHDEQTELPIAAAEQRKITHLRLAKLSEP